MHPEWIADFVSYVEQLNKDLQKVRPHKDQRSKEERYQCGQLLRRIGEVAANLNHLLRVDSSLETKRVLEPVIMELVRTGLNPLKHDSLFKLSLPRLCQWLVVHFDSFPQMN